MKSDLAMDRGQPRRSGRGARTAAPKLGWRRPAPRTGQSAARIDVEALRARVEEEAGGRWILWT